MDEKRRAIMDRYYAKRKVRRATDPAFAEKLRENCVVSHKRAALKPDWKKKRAEQNKKSWRRVKADPVLHEKRKQYLKEWIKRNKDRVRELQKQERVNLRKQVIQHYGGECACCGENIFEFLAIDHINGGGIKHRKEVFGKNWRTGTGQNMCRWLRKNGFPKGFQVLCHNCNSAKGFYGQCPHEKERQWNARSAS